MTGRTSNHDGDFDGPAGRRLSKARLPEGVAAIARLHAMIGDQLGDDVDEVAVAIGIETDRDPRVAAGRRIRRAPPVRSRFQDYLPA
ncbi:hypothetical protein [Rhodococcus erythropolis]|uniref:hypothetical protein n=1 Tax=Rhodococcus erythropolis TaxID=1833 RepID=UPI0024B7A95D|nr:hypothetical protein [Rhodococcus erythropolis]MDJ0015487.1 hypothetical protein [Rhodococcus erythropolis]